MLCSFFGFVSPLFFNSEFLSLFQPCLLFVVFFLNPFFFVILFVFVLQLVNSLNTSNVYLFNQLTSERAAIEKCELNKNSNFLRKKNEQEYRKTPSTIDQILYLSQKNANECSFHFIYCNRKQNSFCLFFVFYFIFRFYCCLHENQLEIYVHLI